MSLWSGGNPGSPLAGGWATAALAAWQLGSYLELGSFPGAVPCARLHAKLVMWEWGMAAIAETVELVVCELVTNAVTASTGLASARGRGQVSRHLAAAVPPVRFWLACDRRNVLIEVWDASDELPVRQGVDPEAEGGRGLLLVEAVSADWGSYVPEGCGGKVAWARVTAT
jgi:anti-sigma regulatory factor (Ser/Thr protein kinase)